MEAPPVELLGGAYLVGKAKVVGPTLLLCAPAAAPAEVEDVCRASRARLEGADEVRAARRAGDRHTVDREVWLVGEHLLQKSLNLDPRDIRVDADARSFSASKKQANVCLEAFIRARTREQCLQLFQLTTSSCRPRR